MVMVVADRGVNTFANGKLNLVDWFLYVTLDHLHLPFIQTFSLSPSLDAAMF